MAALCLYNLMQTLETVGIMKITNAWLNKNKLKILKKCLKHFFVSKLNKNPEMSNEKDSGSEFYYPE